MDWEADLKKAICEGDEVRADEVVAKALEKGVKATDLLERGAVAGIYEAGRLWQAGEFFLVWNEDYEKIGIPSVRAYADEKKVCLMLNLRPDLLEEGPPLTIADTVREVILQGAGKGRFTFLINLVPVRAPVENVHAAVAAAKQFGRYPISAAPEAPPFRSPKLLPFDDWVRKEGLPI